MRLADHLPDLATPDILEIGCGTGHLTHHLLNKYPRGRFVISDLSKAMVSECRKQFTNGASRSYEIVDGEWPESEERFDLIASSMVVHWFEEPLAGLQRLQGLLKPGGRLLFSALGKDSFSQWRAHLQNNNLPVGLLNTPDWPGCIKEENITVHFEDALSFFRTMQGMGATSPSQEYKHMSVGIMRKALRGFDEQSRTGITWHIVYGELHPPAV